MLVLLQHGYLFTQDRMSLVEHVLGQLRVTWDGCVHGNRTSFLKERYLVPCLREEFKNCRKSLLASGLGRDDASNCHLDVEVVTPPWRWS